LAPSLLLVRVCSSCKSVSKFQRRCSAPPAQKGNKTHHPNSVFCQLAPSAAAPTKARLDSRDALPAEAFSALRTSRSLTNLNSPTISRGVFDNYCRILQVEEDEAKRTGLWEQLGPNGRGNVRAQDFMLATIVLSKENAKGMAKGMVVLLGVEGGVDGAGVSQLFRMMASLGRIEMTEAEAEVAAAQFTLRQGRGGRVDQRSLAEGLANTPMLP